MSAITLVFLKSGVAVLEEECDNGVEQTWASDDDEDFELEIGNDPLTEEDDATVRTYLVEQGIITERESQMMSVQVEGDEDIIDADFEVVERPN